MPPDTLPSPNNAGTAIGAAIERPINAAFIPLPDITAYEIAQLLPYFHGKWLMEADWSGLGTATRHMKRNVS